MKGLLSSPKKPDQRLRRQSSMTRQILILFHRDLKFPNILSTRLTMFAGFSARSSPLLGNSMVIFARKERF